MTIVQKSMSDLAAMYERVERMHPYPPFSIEWAFKKPGSANSLLGVVYRVPGSAEGKYTYEVWEVS